MNKRTLRTFDELALTAVRPMSADAIRALRERALTPTDRAKGCRRPSDAGKPHPPQKYDAIGRKCVTGDRWIRRSIDGRF